MSNTGTTASIGGAQLMPNVTSAWIKNLERGRVSYSPVLQLYESFLTSEPPFHM